MVFITNKQVMLANNDQIMSFCFSSLIGQMMLTPAMQGVILAIAKAREAFDKDGPEAGLIKVFISRALLILTTH